MSELRSASYNAWAVFSQPWKPIQWTAMISQAQGPGKGFRPVLSQGLSVHILGYTNLYCGRCLVLFLGYFG